MINKNDFNILCGDSLEVLKTLPDCSVQCCITSPPYYGLRDYGTAVWVGGDSQCNHYRDTKFSESDCTGHKAMGEQSQPVGDAIYKTVCPKCGAVRVDKQIGLEETPEQYIDRLVKVFHEVKRILKDDGTLWVNIGDSYVSTSSNNRNFIDVGGRGGNSDAITHREVSGVYKQKDLYGIPWMLAFALRADGWYLRQDIIWSKVNPMPESVTDRCTKSHEYIFLLSKSEKYLFNGNAIKEDAVSTDGRLPGVVRNRVFDYDSKVNNNPEAYMQKNTGVHSSDEKYLHSGIRFGGDKYGDSDDKHFQTYSGNEYIYTGKRNKRDVWSICVSGYKDAHFATYPEQLVEPCVLAGSSEGDTILDVFNGSGTTGIVAIRNNRKYLGIDLNAEYIRLSMNRFQETFFDLQPITEPIITDGLQKADLVGEE